MTKCGLGARKQELQLGVRARRVGIAARASADRSGQSPWGRSGALSESAVLGLRIQRASWKRTNRTSEEKLW